MIALSILFLAAEIARGDMGSFSHRYPIALSFVFGLLHGFGFASALGEIGLPRAELSTGLLFFNVGVEVGQLAFIGAITALLLGARRLPALLDRITTTMPAAVGQEGYDRLALAGAYGLGIPAAFWFLERSFVAFAA
jgi:hypothetical protein